MRTFTVEQHERIAQELGIESDALFAAMLGRTRHQQRIQDTLDAARVAAKEMDVPALAIICFDLLANHTERLLALGKARRHANDGAAWMEAALQAFDKLFPQGEQFIEVPLGEWHWGPRNVRVPDSVLQTAPDLVRALAQDEKEDSRAWRVPARKILRTMAETLAHWETLGKSIPTMLKSAQRLAPFFDPIASALAEAEELGKDKPVPIGLVDSVEFAVRPQTRSLVLQGHFHFNAHNREEIAIDGEIQSNFFADWYGEENHEKVDPLLAEWGLQLTCPGGDCPANKACDGCEFDGRWKLTATGGADGC